MNDIQEQIRDWQDRYATIFAQVELSRDTRQPIPEAEMNILRKWYSMTCEDE
jgi:hypothetical protein